MNNKFTSYKKIFEEKIALVCNLCQQGIWACDSSTPKEKHFLKFLSTKLCLKLLFLVYTTYKTNHAIWYLFCRLINNEQLRVLIWHHPTIEYTCCVYR